MAMMVLRTLARARYSAEPHGHYALALEHYRPDQLFLNPDCGFGCFASRCVNEEDVAVAKLRAMTAAARELRERHG